MGAWGELAHLAAAVKPAAEFGAALLVRVSLPIGAALIAGRLAAGRAPRDRATVYAMGVAAAAAVCLLSVLPGPPGRPLLTVSLPAPRARPAAAHAARVPHIGAPVAASPVAGRPAPAGPRHRSDARAPHGASASGDNGTAASRSGIADRPDSAAPAPDGARRRTSVAEPASPVPLIYTLAICLWAAGAAVSLLWLALGQIRLALECARLRDVTDESILADLLEISAAIGCRVPRIVAGRAARGPFVMGVLRPRIVLPESMLSASSRSALRSVLAHEVQHVASRDVAWMVAGRLLSALLWPHPLVRLLLRRRQECSEEACDRAAVRHGCSAAEYASLLVEIAASCRRGAPYAAAVVGMAQRESTLGRRVGAILNHAAKEEQTMSVNTRRALLGLFAALLFAAGRLVSAQDAARHTPKSPASPVSSADDRADRAAADRAPAGRERAANDDARSRMEAYERANTDALARNPQADTDKARLAAAVGLDRVSARDRIQEAKEALKRAAAAYDKALRAAVGQTDERAADAAIAAARRQKLAAERRLDEAQTDEAVRRARAFAQGEPIDGAAARRAAEKQRRAAEMQANGDTKSADSADASRGMRAAADAELKRRYESADRAYADALLQADRARKPEQEQRALDVAPSDSARYRDAVRKAVEEKKQAEKRLRDQSETDDRAAERLLKSIEAERRKQSDSDVKRAEADQSSAQRLLESARDAMARKQNAAREDGVVADALRATGRSQTDKSAGTADDVKRAQERNELDRAKRDAELDQARARKAARAADLAGADAAAQTDRRKELRSMADLSRSLSDQHQASREADAAKLQAMMEAQRRASIDSDVARRQSGAYRTDFRKARADLAAASARVKRLEREIAAQRDALVAERVRQTAEREALRREVEALKREMDALKARKANGKE
ncbi:MAG TPA: M56 family metallopeptidase [Chthonomonadaceae bacterium]|nr:M56 family metallopeptidase [Chthonomonadaceae bacterium]